MARFSFLFGLLCLISAIVSCAFGKESIETDHSALLSLKSQIVLDSNSSHLLSNWTEEATICSWFGVECSSLHNRVAALNLSNLGLLGTIPPNIGNLSFLCSIDLSRNNFHGELPLETANLKRLKHIHLNGNNIHGDIPGSLSGSFFNATKLEVLVLSWNHLNGHIPEEIGNLGSLRILNMQFNQFQGTVPPSILNLTSLEVMAFAVNKLTGDLPLNICSKLPKLVGISIPGNQFTGDLQSRLHNCSELQVLSLMSNKFTGQIPREIGNLTGLIILQLGENQFQGRIPGEFGNLQRLTELNLRSNFLSGPIPPSLFNLSSLSIIEFNSNNLSGILPLNVGQQLPNLVALYLGAINLTGLIPNSISNLTKLTFLELANNQLTGSIPASLGNLRSLERFSVFNNFLTSTDSDFLASLTNCRSLVSVLVTQNPLNILLPPRIGNFSSSLTLFHASSCGFSGNIPDQIGNLSGLIYLALRSNNLAGLLPPAIEKLSSLQAIYLNDNKIIGILPNFLCSLKQLFSLNLGGNEFYGMIPECLGSMASLRHLRLEKNNLSSTFPTEIGSMGNLLVLDVHSNSLSGNITPAIGGLRSALSVDLSWNMFSGNIPQTFGNLSLQILNLSHNKLTGEIPESLETLLVLKYLDVSFNHLRGRIPINGSFLNFGIESFKSNDALCGGAFDLHFPPCIHDDPERGSGSWQWLRLIAYILSPIAALMIAFSAILFVLIRKRRKARIMAQVELVPFSFLERVPFYEIKKATNSFSESNLLGRGSFGSVYKAILTNQEFLAVKVFDLQLEGAFKSFETECEVLRNIRHRNLVRIISSCSSFDFKALVLEYMPNESLEKWLYSHNHFLNFSQRLDIMIDVASALDYLHHGYTSPIVHCDIKPSNVLIDEEMVGHVSDFGISKLLGEGENLVQTMTLATVGYTAPEYGSQGIVSTSCDVYSFGILLMETFSRRKPTEDVFEEGWGLREMIMDSLQNSETDFIDPNLLKPENQRTDQVVNCTVSVMKLAGKCTMNSPELRSNMNDVLVELQKIKRLFLSNSV